MRNDTIAAIKRISQASHKQNLVIFIGAGISTNSGVPTWSSLINSFLKELPEKINEKDFLKIAQLYKNQRKHKEYLEKVRSELKHGKVAFNPIHKAVLELRPQHIVTTNYDTLIEQAATHTNNNYYTVKKDSDLPYSLYGRLLVKMHGDLDEGNIVLTEDDYLNYNDCFPLIETYIRSLLASKFILFLGFSFTDYNLKVISNKVLTLLGKDFQPMYLFNPNKTVELERQYYEARGINVIEGDEFLGDLNDQYLTPSQQTELQKLKDDRAKAIYKFLLFIQGFNEFEETNKDFYIIRILRNAIDYYLKDLNVIGPKLIMKIFPFKGKISYSRFIMDITHSEIKKAREYLLKSFENKKEFLKKYKDDYSVIVRSAISNSIYGITYKEAEGNAFFLNYKFPKHKNGIDFFYELNFKQLLTEMAQLKRAPKTEPSIDDLELPYLYYKMHMYYEAYLEYKRLCQTFWNLKKYVLFFICQFNIKKLGRILANDDSFLGTPNFETIKEIGEEIEKIDLTDILNNIKIENEIVSELLEKVDDNTLVYDVINRINELIHKIEESGIATRRGGYSMNYHVDEVMELVTNIFNFYNGNFVISENFSEHKFIYRRAFEGILISNNIPNTNSEFFGERTSKIELILKVHILLGVFYSYHLELRNFIIEENIQTITLHDNASKYIRSLLYNLISTFDSTYKKLNRRTRSDLYNYLNNCLLIISKANLNEDIKIQLLRKITSSTEINISQIDRSLMVLLESFNQKNSQDVLNDLLKILLITPQYRQNCRDLIEDIANRLPVKFIKNLIEENYSDIFPIRFEDYTDLQFFYISCLLYKHIKGRNKVKLADILNQVLIEKNPVEFFGIANHFSIPLEKSSIQKFIQAMDRYLSNNRQTYANHFFLIKTLFNLYKSRIDQLFKAEILSIREKNDFLKFLFDLSDNKRWKLNNLNWIRFLDKKQILRVIKDQEVKAEIKNAIENDPVKYEWLSNLIIAFF